MMLDIEKNIVHWRNGAEEALEVADDLINQNHRFLFGLFFAHLALEKVITAHIWRVKKETPPRIHNLIRLPSKKQGIIFNARKEHSNG
jgi:HEPN domain-containing protein